MQQLGAVNDVSGQGEEAAEVIELLFQHHNLIPLHNSIIAQWNQKIS
jgi:hypothetical protein